MSTEFTVSEDAKNLVQEIIARNGVRDVTDIKYQQGSQVGDGYVSRTIAVDVENGEKPFKIFLKCSLNINDTEMMPINKLYGNEIYFYDIVLPEFKKFLQESCYEGCLRMIPKCYGTASGTLVALENLREKNFTLFDRMKFMNDAHIMMVMKTFARLHAVSFAFKDQKREIYDRLVEKTFDFYSDLAVSFKPASMRAIKEVLDEIIDAEKEKDLLEKCAELDEKLTTATYSARKNINQYSILTQGDCHCMNMMFAYEEGDEENPSDIRLIDWQLIREASPVYDLAYFFYPIASGEALNKLYDYLKIYHEELSNRIKYLGSDPEILYPYDVLVKEWKEWGSRYGFGITFSILRAMLCAQDEVLNMEELDFEDKEAMMKMDFPKLKKQGEYYDRLKSILLHMVKNDFL